MLGKVLLLGVSGGCTQGYISYGGAVTKDGRGGVGGGGGGCWVEFVVLLHLT